LQNLTRLYFDVSENEISNEGAAILGRELSKLKNLPCLQLDISYNIIKN
jgi:hypothetical protein